MPILWFSLVLGESGEGNNRWGRGGWSPTVFGEEKFKKSCAAVWLISKKQRPRSGRLLEKKFKTRRWGFWFVPLAERAGLKKSQAKVGAAVFGFLGKGRLCMRGFRLGFSEIF